MEATTFQRSIICPTCSTICHLCTSRSAKNPGRQYYKCPSDVCRDAQKNFVKWADQVREKEWVDVPICSCKAGVCRVTKFMFGPNAGRMLFKCMIKEGHGSCGYSMWKDELETSTTSVTDENDQSSLKSTLTNSDRGTDPIHADLIYNESCPSELRLDDNNDDELDFIYADEIIQSLSLSASFDCDHGISLTDVNLVEAPEVDDANKKFESFSNIISISGDDSDLKIRDSIEESIEREEMPTYELLGNDTSDNLQCVPVTYAKIERLRSHEEKHSKSSKRPLKRSRHAYLEAQTTLIPMHSFKICLDVKSVSAKQFCWMTAAISQNLSSQLRGWMGRLVFHPSPCLITSPDAKFMHDLDADFEALMTVNRDTLLCESSSELLLHKPEEGGPQSLPCDAPGLLPSRDAEIIICDDNVRGSSISKVFAQAAEILQNDLIALLETTDMRDHRAMRQASEAAFAALDCMFFDHRGLKELVNEFIRCAESLAEIEVEESSESQSHQKLVDFCRSKRMGLDSFKNAQAKTLETMTKNKNRLSDLNRQMVSAKNWLFRIEAELSIFEIDMKTFEDGFENITKGTEVLERDYLISCEELEKSQKIIEQKEAVRNAARDAFDRARLLLRL